MSRLVTTVVTPYAKDIRFLLSTYDERNTYSVQIFKEEWRRLNFSMIHYGCPDEVDKELYTQELFGVVLGFIQQEEEDVPFKVKVAAVYALYFLHQTQRHKPKLRIAIDEHTFRHFLAVRERVQEEHIVDAYYILNRFHDEKAFNFVAHTKIDLSQSQYYEDDQSQTLPDDIDLNVKTIDRSIFDARVINETADEYLKAKSEILDLISTKSSIEDNLPASLEFVPNNFANEIERLIINHEKTQDARKEAFLQEWSQLSKPRKRTVKKRGRPEEATRPTPKRRKTTSAASLSEPENSQNVVAESPREPSARQLEKRPVKKTNDEQRPTGSSIESVVNAFLGSGQLPPPTTDEVEQVEKKTKKKKKQTAEEETTDKPAAKSKTSSKKKRESSKDEEPTKKKKKTTATKTKKTTTKESGSKSKKASSSSSTTSETTTKKKKSKKTLTEAQPNGNEATEPEQTAPAPTTRSGRVVKKTLVALEHEETEREFRRSV